MGANQAIGVRQEDYHQHRSATHSSFGAPLPEGIAPPIKLTSQSDVGVSFAMLDASLKGKLNRGQARLWLRSAGWCLPDEELDALLDDTEVGRDVQEKIAKGSFSALDLKNPDTRMGQWGPEDMISIQEASDLPLNRSVEELSDAFHHLAGARGKVITRDVLYGWASTFGRVNNADIDEALEMIGYGAADSFHIDDLAHLMLQNVVRPPSTMEIHDFNKEARLARDRKIKAIAKFDRVRILKDSQNSGAVAVVIDPALSGRVKVRLPDGTTKTYLPQEVEKIV
jgi:hypothetical protein